MNEVSKAQVQQPEKPGQEIRTKDEVLMATQRSRNRVNEHGEHWIFTGRTSLGIPSSEYKEVRDQPIALMFCEGDCEWSGWLPIADLVELQVLEQADGSWRMR